MTRVHVIATGGTIASKADAQVSGARPVVGAAALVDAIPELRTIAAITYEQFANVGRHSPSFEQVISIATRIDQIWDEDPKCGVVVTQGTMTMEESSYAWDLLIGRSRGTVVVTGAMRHGSLPSPDGPRNLLDAVTAAASSGLSGLGVLVCMNGELHAARDVTKFHTLGVESFKSLDAGPIGFVRNGQVLISRAPTAKQRSIKVSAIKEKVALVPAVIADDGTVINATLNAGIDGLVLQLMGGGAIPPACIPALGRALKKIPVVAASRFPAGSMYRDVYGFEGGDIQLRKMGVVFAGNLPATKARIKLLLLLSAQREFGAAKFSDYENFITKSFEAEAFQ